MIHTSITQLHKYTYRTHPFKHLNLNPIGKIMKEKTKLFPL